MKLPLLSCIASALGLALLSHAQADNLVSVYQQALNSDPTFKQALATWLSTAQNLPIAEAALFPSFDLTGGASRNYSKSSFSSLSSSGYYNNMNYGISVSEPIFSLANWASIRNASAESKSAAATYLAAKQDLISRTATAYFDVLKAASQLRFTIASKNSFWQQLVTSEQKYKVGLIAITPVYDAQAKYDSAVADEIADRNAVDNALENLRAITGYIYPSLAGLKDQVPLYIPTPQDIDTWVNIALEQNYTLKAQRFTLIAQKEAISVAADARYPTVDLSGSYTVNTNSNSNRTLNPNTHVGAVGLSLNFPFYQGGLVSASTKQAEYNYLSASSQLEFQKRDVISGTRQAYLGIVAGVSGVKADRQAVISNQNSLKATEAGYTVGTRTMVDLLDALSQLYQVQKNYMQDQYNYILSIIELKDQAGTLSEQDVSHVNAWLKAQIQLDQGPSRNTYSPSPPSLRDIQKQEGGIPAPMPVDPAEKGPRKGDLPRSPNAPVIGKAEGHRKTSVAPPRVAQDKKGQGKAAVLSASAPYTIQLYAATKRAVASEFMQAHQLQGKAHVLQMGSWYKVVWGEYASFSAAQQAERQLPSVLAKLHPWITRL